MSYPNYPPYGVDPARAYYMHGQPPPPPPVYPPPNGYPQAPQSPSAQPPARPHTTAPYPSPSQYAPPPAGYYPAPQQPPPANGHPPPAPPAALPTPSASGYPPQTPAAPPVPTAPYGDMAKFSPEQLQGMIDQLQNLKMSKSPAPGPPPQPAAPNGHHPTHSPPPRIDTSMAPPPGHHHAAPPSARGHHSTPSHSSAYPYPYHYKSPASHSGDISPPAPAERPSKPAVPMPGSFFPEHPAPPPAPAPPPKTPGPHGRPDPRKAPEQSEISFSSSKSHELDNAWNQWGGQLVEVSAGREPRPKPKLVSLFRGIAAHMISALEPAGSYVVTVSKLIQFYSKFPVGENEAAEWQRFFNQRSPKLLSDLFCALNVEHHLVPIKPNQTPSIPGLTLLGFEVWMFTQLMTAPHREWIRLSKVLDQWTIYDEMPKVIPRQCFPQSEDRAIYAGWWQAVREEYPEDPLDDSDEERKVPLGLPEPPGKGARARSYSTNLRGGDLPHDMNEDDYRDSLPPDGPSSLPRQGRVLGKPNPKVPDPHEFLTPEEREKEPTLERRRAPYGGPAANPAWAEDTGRREDVNPRPTLGEEPSRPLGRSRSTRRPAGGKEPVRRSTKRSRSQHRPRREDSPEGGRYSDEDYDEHTKPDGYGKRFNGDGLYEVPAPSHTPTGSGSQFHREQSRGPPKSRLPPPPPEKDISEYTYQDQYEKDYSSGGGRPPRKGGDPAHGPHGGGGSRQSWRYGQ